MRNSSIRKPNRLKNHDYSQKGAYFVTICIKGKHEILGQIVTTGAAECHLQLSEIGQIVKDEITILSTIYINITVDTYVIMPNHVHMIILIANNEHNLCLQDCERQNTVPTVSQIMNQWKRSISIKLGFSPWQKSFHDHIIRSEKDYRRIVEYIKNNPSRWVDDCYYKPYGRHPAARIYNIRPQ